MIALRHVEKIYETKDKKVKALSDVSLSFRDICAAAGAARGSGPGAYNAMSPRTTPGSERDMFYWALQVPTKP